MTTLALCASLLAQMNGFACLDHTATITPEEVYPLAIGAGFTDDEIPTLLCVINGESSFRPKVFSGTSYGLMQIHRGWWEGFTMSNGKVLPPARPDWSPEYMMDAGNALHAAKYVHDRMGWDAWLEWDGYSNVCD